jgi:hypothetical protein
MRDLFAKVRPQILFLIPVLGTITLFAMRTGATEVAGVAVGGMIALGMKILEDKD